MSPQELLAIAHDIYAVSAIALTDINSTSGCLSFVRQAMKYNIKPVLGIDFRNGIEQKFIGIAKNNEGYRSLNELLSHYLHNNLPIPAKAPPIKNAYILYPFDGIPDNLSKNEFVAVKPDDLPTLSVRRHNLAMHKLVACPTITFRNKQDFNTHRLLRAIDNNVLLSKLPKSEEGRCTDLFLGPQKYQSIYSAYPELLANADMLMNNSTVTFDFSPQSSKNLQSYTGSEVSDYKLLRRMCIRGLQYRYPKYDVKILRRIAKELLIIKQKRFVSYFLINCKIINYARQKGYYYVGRGSGANSVIAYLLRITDVDPIDLDLYFERFINLYRQSPPDFDIDFSSGDRDDITDFIFKFFNKKSPDGVALLATFNTFQQRAAIREIGKVFGLPPHEIDRLTAGHAAKDKMAGLVLKYSQYIAGLPSHLSIHAGGILISNQPIFYFTATSKPPKGYPTTHFDMHIAEDVGLHKFDILAQRGLGKIKDCLALIKTTGKAKEPIDIHDFKTLKGDEKIKRLLREARAIGCFYVESPAMRMLLKKLRADEYLGLVAASSIIRPGVAKSGMMRQYIVRFREPERREDAHPVLREIMPDTFGIMVYQEDVIKVAYHFAGLDLGESDVLRRGMSGKFRSRKEFQRVKAKFFQNCHEKGYAPQLSHDVWRQIESFAGYAFAKGHSASYAVESYQSLFLKAHYPLEYMVATINNGGGFYGIELYVHEARMHGANILPPCVNISSLDTQIRDKDIYLGFRLVKELEEKLVASILQERHVNGSFLSLEDFVKRVKLTLDQLLLLIKVGAFRFTGMYKKELAWRAHFLSGKGKMLKQSLPLFDDVSSSEWKIPTLSYNPLEDAFDEMQLIGFPLCSPFGLVYGALESTLCVSDFKNYVGQQVTITGYLVAIKNTRTTKGDRMNFGTFLDLNGDFIDTVHFPISAKKWPFRGKGVYTITGKVVEEYDFQSLEVCEMKKERYVDDPRYSLGSEGILNTSS